MSDIFYKKSNSPQNSHLIIFESVFFAGIITWLLMAALTVSIEYYDGLDTIVNIERFNGKSAPFITNRAPMISILLVPASWIHDFLELSKTDFRVYKIFMGILHALYLITTYFILTKVFERSLYVFVAFVAAVPTFVFFSYAPFLSHDILPGVILLAMLYLADKLLKDYKNNTLLLLVILGACAALIKHVYGIFWISLTLSYITLLIFGKLKHYRNRYVTIFRLIVGATLSGILTWLVLALTISPLHSTGSLIDTLASPYLQLKFLLTSASGNTFFPPWVYVANLFAYGMIAIALLPIGIALSLKGSTLQKSTTITLIAIILFMHTLDNKEVRYLAHLSPAIALTIVPAIKYLFENILHKYIILFLLVISLSPFHSLSPIKEAYEKFSTFYRNVQFNYNGLDESLEIPENIMINWNLLSYTPNDKFHFAGDPYHKIFHVGKHHLAHFTSGYLGKVIYVGQHQFKEMLDWPDNMAMVISETGLLVNPPRLSYHTNINDSHIKQITLKSRIITVDIYTNTLTPPNSGIPLQALDDGTIITRITRNDFYGEPANLLYDRYSYKLIHLEGNTYRISGMRELPKNQSKARLKYFSIITKH